MLSVIKHATDTVFFLSATQHISAQCMVCAKQLAFALQNFISSTATGMVPAARHELK